MEYIPYNYYTMVEFLTNELDFLSEKERAKMAEIFNGVDYNEKDKKDGFINQCINKMNNKLLDLIYEVYMDFYGVAFGYITTQDLKNTIGKLALFLIICYIKKPNSDFFKGGKLKVNDLIEIKNTEEVKEFLNQFLNISDDLKQQIVSSFKRGNK